MTDPDWLYSEESRALYGPGDSPHLRVIVATEVEPKFGRLIADVMNRAPEPTGARPVTADVQRRLAEALAEKFTSPRGARNPDWDWEKPDGPDNLYHLPVEMAERIEQPPYVVFTAGDGLSAIRMPSCTELAETLLPAVNDEKARLANAWDEGFEAGATYVARNPGPSGVISDPPRNPYDEEHP